MRKDVGSRGNTSDARSIEVAHFLDHGAPRLASRRTTCVKRIKIFYDSPGWAYHRKALSLQSHAPADFATEIGPLRGWEDLEEGLRSEPYDLVFVLPIHETAMVRAAVQGRGWATKVVGSWNSGWPREGADFQRAYEIADAMVVNSKSAWENSGAPLRAHYLPNGVDLEVFRVRVPPGRRAPKVLWMGSRHHREIKGYELRIRPLRAELAAAGIECDFALVDSLAPPRNVEQMVQWYNEGTVFVCASHSEGTPNTALEAAGCGCTLVSTPVGNMPELIRDDQNGYLVDGETPDLAGAVRRAIENYPRLTRELQRDIRNWSWREASVGFYALFRSVLGESPAAPPSPGGARRR